MISRRARAFPARVPPMSSCPRLSFLFLFALLCGNAALESVAHAQLSLRSSMVVNGNYAMIGNALVDCPAAGSCANNRTALIPVDRDSVALGDLDRDGADDTTMSASSTLVIPAGAVVRSATLYIGAFASSTSGDVTGPAPWSADLTTADVSTLFAGPSAPYTALTPLAVRSYNGDRAYQARYDVTNLVSGALVGACRRLR